MKQILIATLLFTIFSCSKDQNLTNALIEKNDDYTSEINLANTSTLNLDFFPEEGFLDGFYEGAINELGVDVVHSCECSDLNAVQDYWIKNGAQFMEPFNPQVFDCETMQNRCIDSPRELLDKFYEYFPELVQKQIVVSEEYDILQELFLNISEDIPVNLINVKADISNALRDYPNKANAGVVSAITLKWIDESYYKDGDVSLSKDGGFIAFFCVTGGFGFGRLYSGLATAVKHDDPESTQFGIDVWCSITD